MRRRIVADLKRIFARPDGERGNALVGFALILPALMTLFYGIVEFSRVLFTQGILLLAAEEATRFAVVNYNATEAQIQEVAEDRFIMIDAGKISSFNVSSTLDATDQTKDVTVEITYAFEPIMPILWTSISLVGHSRGFIVLE